MTISFMKLSNTAFRLTSRQKDEVVSEARPDFQLTEEDLIFRAKQITAENPRTPLQSALYFLKHFTRMFWGYFTHPSIYEECNPIMLEANVELKTTRYREQTMVYMRSEYSRDMHDYTTPKLDGGMDFSVTPIAYTVNENEVKRREFETFAERLGLSTVLFLIPVLLLIATGIILAPTLGMIAIFVAVVLYPLIVLLFVFWRRDCKRLETKAAQKAIELNKALRERQY